MSEMRPLTDDEAAELAVHIPQDAKLISATTGGRMVEAVVELPEPLKYFCISLDALRSVT